MAPRKKDDGGADAALESRSAEEAEAESAGLRGLSHSELIEMARRSLIQAVPATATALADGAHKGSLPHIKLLMQLVGLDNGQLASKETRPKEKTMEEILMELWEQEP